LAHKDLATQAVLHRSFQHYDTRSYPVTFTNVP
jgi:hypothetical protein